jgi:hypothetical protein
MPAPRGGTTLWHLSFRSHLLIGLVALEVSGHKAMLGDNELLIGALTIPKIADLGFNTASVPSGSVRQDYEAALNG